MHLRLPDVVHSCPLSLLMVSDCAVISLDFLFFAEGGGLLDVVAVVPCCCSRVFFPS